MSERQPIVRRQSRTVLGRATTREVAASSAGCGRDEAPSEGRYVRIPSVHILQGRMGHLSIKLVRMA